MNVKPKSLPLNGQALICKENIFLKTLRIYTKILFLKLL